MKVIKEKMDNLINKCKPQEEKGKKTGLMVILALVILAGLLVAVVLMFTGKKEEVVYKETEVVKGKLSVGISESGSVDIGTTVQSFELDISEFTGSSGFTFTGGQSMGGGAPVAGGIMQGGAEQMMAAFTGQVQTGSSSASDRQLEIEEVYIEAGQEIREGDPILKLTEETVGSIRSELSEDVSSAELVYEQAVTAGKQSDLEADLGYKTNVLYGTYASAEYNQTVGALEDAVTEAEEALAKAQENLTSAREELAEKETLLTEQKQVLENAVYTEQTTDKANNLYWWLVAYQTVTDTEDMVTTLEDEIEALQEEIETYTGTVTESETALLLAKKELETGKINASGELDKRNYKSENAQEIYDVTIEQSNFNIENAKADFEEADEKLQAFDAVIKEQIIYAEANGVVTELFVGEGDTLTTNMELFYLNDYDEVTITLSIAEEDMETVKTGEKIHVTVAAFPEEVFSGKVSEIGDAEIDSSTNKTMYSVTVTVENMGNLLYQDMTAEVTFVTEETAEVLYVPNRAITEKEGKSYVKVKSAEGDAVEKEVICGFTDGINTEIKEGLTEGEIILTASKTEKG